MHILFSVYFLFDFLNQNLLCISDNLAVNDKMEDYEYASRGVPPRRLLWKTDSLNGKGEKRRQTMVDYKHASCHALPGAFCKGLTL